MKKILFLLLLAAFGYFTYSYFFPPPPPPPPPTPEAQLQALVAGKPVSAELVARLCQRFPSQAKSILRGREIEVTGTIKKLWVRGIESADMDIDLVGVPGKDVVFTTDYARYNTAHTGRQQYGYKLLKEKGRLLFYARVEGGSSGNGSPSYTKLERVLFTEREKVTLKGIVEIVGPGHVKIHYSEGIRAAKRS